MNNKLPHSSVTFDGDAFHIGGERLRTLVISGCASDDWKKMQASSIDEYRSTHVDGNIDSSIMAYYRLFRGFAISSVEIDRPVVLDVGCGISPGIPPYASGLESRWNYVGLDPIEENLSRNYPFICSRIEDAAREISKSPLKFDMFLFCTSLDHFEDIGSCATSVKALSSDGAVCVFWVGLHDPDLVAAPEGGFVFSKLMRMNPFSAFMAYFAYGLIRLPGLIRRMYKRKRDLALGHRLDNLHFWYFTKNSINEVFSEFGDVEETLFIPNTNYVFVRVRVKNG